MNENPLSWLLSLTEQYSSWWIIKVFIVVLLTLTLNHIAKYIYNKMEAYLHKTDNIWDDALFAAARKPVTYSIWLLGISIAVTLLKDVADSSFFTLFEPARRIALILIVAWFLIRFIREVEDQFLNKRLTSKDATTIHATAKLFRLSVVITVMLVILQSLGYSISGVLAFGGVGGVAVGFAAKDLLANFFGGLMLYLDQPFKVGDWVRSPDRNIEGTVEEIGWRLTRIRTFDKRPLYVPNSMFANIALENPSRMQHRRLYETIGVRYADIQVMASIVKEVKEMLQHHEDIASQQTLMVNFNVFGPSSIDFFIYAFTKTTDWVQFHSIKQEILLKVAKIIADNHAEIAYPTSTIHLQQNSQEQEAFAKMTD